MGSTDSYVVLATQLNRVHDKPVLAGGTGGPLGDPLKRGQTFTADDVTPAEIDRWLTLKPRVIITEKELAESQETAASQRAAVADLQAQLDEANAKLAAVQGVAEAAAEGLPQPAPNKSKSEWTAYALDKARRAGGGTVPEDELSFIHAEDTTRDDLAKRYGSST